MARGFEEYQYYDKKYQTDLNELKKIRNDERKIRDYEEKDVFEDDSISKDKKKQIKKIMKQYSEEWGDDEVDAEKVLEMEEDRLKEISNDDERNDLA